MLNFLLQGEFAQAGIELIQHPKGKIIAGFAAIKDILTGQIFLAQRAGGAGIEAFAAALARGEDLTAAAASAKSYIEQAIISGTKYKIGNGYGPVNHGFNPIKTLIYDFK